jgi:mono/diheme cytochrome c family protein
MILAITAQQAVGIVIALVTVLAWALYLLANSRKAKPEVGSEVELASNRRPYLSDEQLEGPKLDRALTWGLVSLAIIGVGLPLYWLAEPGRQSGAIDNFNETFAHRGEGLFAATDQGGFNCAGCHGGNSAIGGEVQYTLTDPATGNLRQVTWKAPALNVATLRWSDDQLREILTYGRPFSPMPAWGIDGGGPMNEQQIDNLIAYMHSIELTSEEAQAQAEADALEELNRLRTLPSQLRDAQAKLEEVQADSASTSDDQLAAEQAVAALEAELALDQQASMGAALFNLQCARCHTLGWSYDEPQAPGGGAYGPPLYNTVNQFPAVEDQHDWVANGAELGERYGLNGQSSGRMAFFNRVLTEDQINDIVAYERTLTPPAAGGGS